MCEAVEAAAAANPKCCGSIVTEIMLMNFQSGGVWSDHSASSSASSSASWWRRGGGRRSSVGNWPTSKTKVAIQSNRPPVCLPKRVIHSVQCHSCWWVSTVQTQTWRGTKSLPFTGVFLFVCFNGGQKVCQSLGWSFHPPQSSPHTHTSPLPPPPPPDRLLESMQLRNLFDVQPQRLIVLRCASWRDPTLHVYLQLFVLLLSRVLPKPWPAWLTGWTGKSTDSVSSFQLQSCLLWLNSSLQLCDLHI